MRCLAIVSVAAVVLLGACATSNTAAMLDAGLGTMTYEEAVGQFGRPLECTDTGSTRRCTWIRWRGPRHQSSTGVVQMGVTQDPPVAYLTFTDGILSDWHLSGQWK